MKLRVSPLLTACFLVGVVIPFANAANDELCKRYEEHYEGANKEQAYLVAEGITDNSAPRATLRKLETIDERLFQLILIEQMKAHGCLIPKSMSSGSDYFSDALDCRTEIMKGNTQSVECDRSKWKKQ